MSDHLESTIRFDDAKNSTIAVVGIWVGSSAIERVMSALCTIYVAS